jgi:hypothetical protein
MRPDSVSTATCRSFETVSSGLCLTTSQRTDQQVGRLFPVHLVEVVQAQVSWVRLVAQERREISLLKVAQQKARSVDVRRNAVLLPVYT